MFSRFALVKGRRRSGGRRKGEQLGAFVDLHGWLLFLGVMSVVALNFLDAWFTVYFLSLGGTELNPLVDWVISRGTGPFILLKSVGIGLCVGVLTVTKNFPVARFGLGTVIAGYSLLLCWHLYLLSGV